MEAIKRIHKRTNAAIELHNELLRNWKAIHDEANNDGNCPIQTVEEAWRQLDIMLQATLVGTAAVDLDITPAEQLFIKRVLPYGNLIEALNAMAKDTEARVGEITWESLRAVINGSDAGKIGELLELIGSVVMKESEQVMKIFPLVYLPNGEDKVPVIKKLVTMLCISFVELDGDDADDLDDEKTRAYAELDYAMDTFDVLFDRRWRSTVEAQKASFGLRRRRR